MSSDEDNVNTNANTRNDDALALLNPLHIPLVTGEDENGETVEGFYACHVKTTVNPIGGSLQPGDVEHLIIRGGAAYWGDAPKTIASHSDGFLDVTSIPDPVTLRIAVRDANTEYTVNKTASDATPITLNPLGIPIVSGEEVRLGREVTGYYAASPVVVIDRKEQDIRITSVKRLIISDGFSDWSLPRGITVSEITGPLRVAATGPGTDWSRFH